MSVRKGKRRGIDREMERVYYHFSERRAVPNELGRQQFHNWTSINVEPAEPDLYFEDLREGRKWYFWLQQELFEQYETNEWPGWLLLFQDWQKDLWVLKHLTKWYLRESWDSLKERVCKLLDETSPSTSPA